MKLRIGDKDFKVTVLDSDEDKQIGLKGVKSLPKGEGIVLKYEKEQVVPITMKDMLMPIDIIFSRGGKISKIVSASPGDKDIVTDQPSDMIFEASAGSLNSFKEGGTIELIGVKHEDGTISMADGGVASEDGKMHVLDEDGKNQMNLEGRERIFSRKHTRKIIDLSKKAYESKDDVDYKSLGKAIMKMVITQDNQEQEYTKG